MAVQSRFRHVIASVDELRELIGEPSELVWRKELRALDEHGRRFIAHSPYLLIGTSNRLGQCTVSPKGDTAGFVRILDDRTLLIPDRPGNKRIDGLRNIVENPHVGLLFLIPNVGETLRVNGRACLVRDADLLGEMGARGKVPVLAIGVEIEQAFIHCPKSAMRADLWEAARRDSARPVASFACMLAAHVKVDGLTVEEVQRRFEANVATQL
jgi:PPOX class probable FMN-dependent enzyme